MAPAAAGACLVSRGIAQVLKSPDRQLAERNRLMYRMARRRDTYFLPRRACPGYNKLRKPVFPGQQSRRTRLLTSERDSSSGPRPNITAQAVKVQGNATSLSPARHGHRGRRDTARWIATMPPGETTMRTRLRDWRMLRVEFAYKCRPNIGPGIDPKTVTSPTRQTGVMPPPPPSPSLPRIRIRDE